MMQLSDNAATSALIQHVGHDRIAARPASWPSPGAVHGRRRTGWPSDSRAVNEVDRPCRRPSGMSWTRARVRPCAEPSASSPSSHPLPVLGVAW